MSAKQEETKKYGLLPPNLAEAIHHGINYVSIYLVLTRSEEKLL
jgi:hypothetical protein